MPPQASVNSRVKPATASHATICCFVLYIPIFIVCELEVVIQQIKPLFALLFYTYPLLVSVNTVIPDTVILFSFSFFLLFFGGVQGVNWVQRWQATGIFTFTGMLKIF